MTKRTPASAIVEWIITGVSAIRFRTLLILAPIVVFICIEDQRRIHHLTSTMYLRKNRGCLVGCGSGRSISAILKEQRHQQDRIQNLIYRQQHPIKDCNEQRILEKNNGNHDGFALEIQDMARALQIGMSSERTLVITPEWTSNYEPTNCRDEVKERWAENEEEVDEEYNDDIQPVGWECFWEPVSSCSVERSLGDNKNVPANGTSSAGIMEGKVKSTYFDAKIYGPTRVVDALAFPWKQSALVDSLPYWERTFGRFWVRAQMAHYLFRPTAHFDEQIKQRFPSSLFKPDGTQRHPYIAFHIRKTDNVADFAKDFGRDAMKTRSLDWFLRQAETLRKDFPSYNLRHIFLATDNSDVIQESQDPKWNERGWEFHIQAGEVQRSNKNDRVWFSGGRSAASVMIATDLDIMRRADFLVGSYQSNVYRLATELNMAWNMDRYPISLDRHRAADVEWYEDP